MAEKASNVVLNFKMSGQVQYAKTIREINAIMNTAAKEYRTHIAAMGKDADQTKKLAAEKKKLEIQMEAARERTKMLRDQYEAMAKDTNTTTGQLAQMYGKLQDAERAEIALEKALDRVNEGLSEQAIESREAEKALNQLEAESEALEMQTEKLNAEYELQVAQLGENASESDKLRLKMEHLEKAHELAGEKVKNYEEQLEQAKKQYGENSAEVDKYELQLIEARTAEQELANEIKTTNKQLKEQEDVLKKTSDKLKDAGGKMKDVGKDLSMKVTAPIVGFGTLAAKSAIDFESAFAGVRKTVDATEEEFAELEQGIRDMSQELPASATEIAGVAEAAGQLGISKEHILEFTRTMIDLGEATNLSAEEAATEFARFANIVGMSQEDFDKLGSAVVGLGNNLATTESEIVSMAMRIAGAGAQVGLTEAEILSFSGALSSVGIEAEAGGSAFSKVMIDIANSVANSDEKLSKFAEVAGMSAKDFAAAFEKDASGAIMAFISGLGKLSDEGENTFAILEDLEFKEVRVRDALLRASSASDVFTDALKIGSEAWEENTALSDEAAQRYETTASQLEMLKNTFTDLAIDIGEILIPMIMDIVEAFKPWIERFKEMDESTQKVIIIIAGLVAAIGPLLIVLGALVSGIGALLSPIGLVVAAIIALIAIGVALWKNWDTIKEKAAKFKDDVVKKFNELKEKATNAIQNFKDNIAKKIQEAKTNFINRVNEIKDGAIQNFLSLKDRVTEIWDNIKNAIMKPINTARDAVKKAVDRIKSIMDFEWSLPKLKVPKVSVSMKKNSWGIPYPDFNIDWRAKGAIFTQPTIFGMSNGRLQGAGEAGPEAVLPLNDETLGAIGKGIAASMEGNGDIEVHVYLDVDEVSSKLAPGMSKKLNQNNKIAARRIGVIRH